MPIRLALTALASVLLLAPQPLARAAAPQAINPAQPRSQASLAVGNSLQQVSVTIAHLRRALDSVNVSKWKAPGDVRRTTAGDVDSMQSDIADTLPGLINTALGNPAKISPAFAVYRNVDALYDVLLRVSETAQLAGASRDAAALEEQRTMLESSRSQLGAALLQSSQAQDSEVVRLRTAIVNSAPPPQPSKTVVDDGPAAKSKPRKRTRKPAAPQSNPQ